MLIVLVMQINLHQRSESNIVYSFVIPELRLNVWKEGVQYLLHLRLVEFGIMVHDCPLG